MDIPGNRTDVTLDQLMGAFNHHIANLQKLVLSRGVNVGEYPADLGALDVAVRAVEQQVMNMKVHLKGNADSMLKVRTVIELSKHQGKKLEQIFADFPSQLPREEVQLDSHIVSSTPSVKGGNHQASAQPPMSATKEKKGKGPPPRCYVNAEEFASLSSYMKGRLTVDKVNTAIDEMATFAEANARLLSTQRRKLADDNIEKVLELREIEHMDAVKGKHFFTDPDMRGQMLKLDNTGKAILTVLRHLGRTSEVRVGRQRVFTITKL